MSTILSIVCILINLNFITVNGNQPFDFTTTDGYTTTVGNHTKNLHRNTDEPNYQNLSRGNDSSLLDSGMLMVSTDLRLIISLYLPCE